MKSLIKLCFCFFLLFPVSVMAELPKQVELDFAVLSGYVIMPINDEFLIDLDDRDNLHVGDVLTLVTPGKKVFHPVTKEILGSVVVPTGYLKVTRIGSGYSYAKLLSAESEPKNGAQVNRFEQVPALFAETDGGDGALARQIMMDLPQFKWLQDGDDEQPLLTFALKVDTLLVKTADGNLLHSYAVVDNQQLEAPREIARRPFVAGKTKPKPKLLDQLANSVLSTLSLQDEDPFSSDDIGIIRQSNSGQRGIWRGPNLSGNPVGVQVADLDGDGLQETAVALDNKLLIGQVNQQEYTDKAEVKIPLRLQILSMDVADLNNNGRPELYLTAVDGHQLASFVVEFNGSDYDIIIADVDWYLRVVELPEQKQVLIGQRMGHDIHSFSGDPFHVRMEGGRLLKGEKVTLPNLANMYSFIPFTDKENQLYYAYLSMDDYLMVVSASGAELWESAEYYGGSESCFDNRKETDGELVVPTCIGPRLIKGPDNEILVVQNEGQRLMQRYHKYKKSRLVALTWNGFNLDENWKTASQKGYLSDFTVADANNDGKMELVMAVKFKHKGILDEARAAIVTYELD